VSAFVDTNVLIRHLTGDPPGPAARATRLLARTDQALEVYEVHRLDFADAYLVAEAETSGVNAVASFDKAIERVPTVRRVEP
jgi:predicted nucleic acid-binding protein